MNGIAIFNAQLALDIANHRMAEEQARAAEHRRARQVGGRSAFAKAIDSLRSTFRQASDEPTPVLPRLSDVPYRS